MQPGAVAKPRWWLWPTILSLDAPAVVVCWQWMLARAAGQRPSAPEALVLGCSVWLAYCADRWIEACRVAPADLRTFRHAFPQRHRWPVAAVWGAVLALDLGTALGGLSRRQLGAGAVLLAAVLAYLFSHQLIHRTSRWRPPKEACVAVLLGSGAALFAACRPGADLRGLAVPLALFAALCLANCALISLWEHEVDRAQGQTSLALQLGSGAAAAHALPWAVAGASGAALAFGDCRAAAACAAASGLLLGAVDLAEPRIGRVLARVLADAVLLTPLVPLVAGARP